METEITNKEIEDLKDYLINCFGTRNINNTSKKDFRKAILLKRLKENIKDCKKGDIVYRFNNYKDEIEDLKEYIVYDIKENIFGCKDIIINKGNGYIAGGLDGKAVLKTDWLQYKKEIKIIKNGI